MLGEERVCHTRRGPECRSLERQKDEGNNIASVMCKHSCGKMGGKEQSIPLPENLTGLELRATRNKVREPVSKKVKDEDQDPSLSRDLHRHNIIHRQTHRDMLMSAHK